ncbi:MAG: c-type cytochrome [Burkholderiaceae bacterium]
MSSNATVFRVLALAAAAIVVGVASGCAPAPVVGDEPISSTDAFAARRLAQKNNCLRCHSVATKQKEGPTYTEVAAKYRAQPNAEGRLYDHLTSGMATLPDGTREEHKVIRARTPEQVRNLVSWILEQ